MTMTPTTPAPSNGDERIAAALDKCQQVAIASGAYESYGAVREAFAELRAALATSQPVAQEAIPPIERDESMDRAYIPLPGGWEIQTQGKGSTFRICNTKTGDRWPVLDKMIHGALEQMARNTHSAAAALASPQSSQGAEDPYHEHSMPPVKRVGKPAVDAAYLEHLQAQEEKRYWGEHERAAPHPPVSAEAATVEQAISLLKIALRDSKGWMLDYSDAIIRDAIDRKDVSAEAGKGVDLKLAEDLAKLGWQTVVCDLCGQTARGFPSGEVSERVAKCSAILTLIDNYAPEKLGTAERTNLAVAVDAVLALAGSGGKS